MPIEALYAEVLKEEGLIETLQQKYRVIITSPTTMSAILNSLQMGFRTFAIERRSSEIWHLLDNVKREFGNFSTLLAKTKVKLEQASKVMGDAENKSKLINTHFKKIEDTSAIYNDKLVSDVKRSNS